MCNGVTCDSGLAAVLQLILDSDVDLSWLLVDQTDAVVARPETNFVSGVTVLTFTPDASAYTFANAPFLGTSYFLKPILLDDTARGRASVRFSAALFQAAPPRLATCGNDQIEEGETCDSEEVPGSCTDLQYPGGALSCTWNCQVDDSTCERCTNQASCNGFPRSSCLTSGKCGACQVDEDCPAPYPCFNGECRLN